jgi:hypothetical protein
MDHAIVPAVSPSRPLLSDRHVTRSTQTRHSGSRPILLANGEPWFSAAYSNDVKQPNVSDGWCYARRTRKGRRPAVAV